MPVELWKTNHIEVSSLPVSRTDTVKTAAPPKAPDDVFVTGKKNTSYLSRFRSSTKQYAVLASRMQELSQRLDLIVFEHKKYAKILGERRADPWRQTELDCEIQRIEMHGRMIEAQIKGKKDIQIISLSVDEFEAYLGCLSAEMKSKRRLALNNALKYFGRSIDSLLQSYAIITALESGKKDDVEWLLAVFKTDGQEVKGMSDSTILSSFSHELLDLLVTTGVLSKTSFDQYIEEFTKVFNELQDLKDTYRAVLAEEGKLQDSPNSDFPEAAALSLATKRNLKVKLENKMDVLSEKEAIMRNHYSRDRFYYRVIPEQRNLLNRLKEAFSYVLKSGHPKDSIAYSLVKDFSVKQLEFFGELGLVHKQNSCNVFRPQDKGLVENQKAYYRFTPQGINELVKIMFG